MKTDADIFLGVAIGKRSIETITNEVVAAIDRKRPRIIFACANPHSLVVAQADEAFKADLNSADHVVADGVGVTLMAKVAGVQVGPRITGTDYFFAVMHALDRRGGGRVFFFGSSQNTLNVVAKRMMREFPRLRLCGVLSPPFGVWTAEENATMVKEMKVAQPDVLWVGLTAPKQEKWVADNCGDLDVPVIGSIGAVFDFFAGTHPRAPRWMCKCGIEWVYRLIKEPRRMWRRNFVSSPKFIALVLWRHVLKVRIRDDQH